MPHPLFDPAGLRLPVQRRRLPTAFVDSPQVARRRRQLAFQTSAKLPPEIEPGWARTAELLLFVMTISFGE